MPKARMLRLLRSLPTASPSLSTPAGSAAARGEGEGGNIPPFCFPVRIFLRFPRCWEHVLGPRLEKPLCSQHNAELAAAPPSCPCLPYGDLCRVFFLASLLRCRDKGSAAGSLENPNVRAGGREPLGKAGKKLPLLLGPAQALRIRVINP